MAWRAQSPGGKGAAGRWSSPAAAQPRVVPTLAGKAATAAKAGGAWQPAWKTAAAANAGKGAAAAPAAAAAGKAPAAKAAGKAGSGPIKPAAALAGKAQPAGKAAVPALGKAAAAGKASGAATALKAKEAKDSADFKPLLAAATKEATAAEGAVEALGKRAATTSSTPPKAEEALEKVLSSIETAAQEAQKKIDAARTDISSKLMTVKSYAPEAQKQARSDLQALQQKMGVAQGKLVPLKNFKKEFTKIADIKTALTEAGEKLQEVETGVTKAEALVKGEVDDEKLTQVEELLAPVQKVVGQTKATINQKSKAGGDVVKPEVEKLQKRIEALTKKVEGVNNKIKGQKAEKAATEWAEKAEEHAAKCEASMNKCQDAEMPFLKGMEVLPKEESDEALAESDAASKECTADIGKAKTYLRMRTAELKGFPKDIAESITEQLKPIQARLDKVDTKLQNFKKETAERKVAALLAEAHESVADAEKAAEALEKDSKALSGDDATVEALKAAITKSNEGIQEASKAIHAAKKVVGQKQREAGKSQGSSAPLQKIQARVSACDSKVGKAKNVIQNAEKLIKVKTVLESEGKKLDEIEGELKKVVDAVPAEGAAMGEEQVKAMDEGAAGVSKSLGGLGAAISGVMGGASASSKEALQKLLDRKSDAQSKLQELKKSNKERREKVLSGAYVKEAQACAAALEAGTAALAKAELPYLKGIEVLPLKETKAVLEASEKAIKETQEAAQQLKNYVATKTNEMKGFGEETAKAFKEGVAGLTEKLKEAETQLASFRKDTEGRAKAARIQEAEEQVAELEAELKRLQGAVEPFKKEGDAALKDDAVMEPLKKFLETEKEVQAKLAKTRNFVNARKNDAKGNTEQTETVNKLTTKIAELQKELSKTREPIVPHEQKHIGKCMVADAKEKVKGLPEEIKTATAAAEPLLEEDGLKFLVDTSIRTLAKALTAHMKAKELTPAALFKEAGGGKQMNKAAFVKYLEKLPEAIGHEEIAFPAERRDAIFARLDKNGGGKVSADEFASIFHEKFAVSKEVTVTSTFELEGSETICKLAANEEVECFGEEKEGEKGLIRRECKVVSSGKTGWVTKRQGTKSFLYAIMPWKSFCNSMDGSVAKAQSNIQGVSQFITKKIKECGVAKEGPLAEARDELKKIEEQAKKSMSEMDELRKKVVNAKKKWQDTERAELNAHVDAKNKKEAAALVQPAVADVEKAEAASKAAVEAAAPMASLSDEDTVAFATPTKVLDAVEAAVAKATEVVSAAKKKISEQLTECGKTKPPTGGTQEARTQLNALSKRVEEALKTARKAASDVKLRCNNIIKTQKAVAAVGLRKEAAKKTKGCCEKLFEQLSKNKDTLPEATFCSTVSGLAGVKIPAEHAKLVSRHVARGEKAIGKRDFLRYVQLFYEVVKDSVFTSEVDVGAAKIARKAETGELVEVLEGPIVDEKSELERVRVKSLVDSEEGWMTLKGNQGTAFLKEVEKPYFSIKMAVSLDAEAKASKAVRQLSLCEVVELLGGPVTEVAADVERAKVKTAKDNLVGWITLKDQHSDILCKPSDELEIKASVALTDGSDIKICKVVRKLEVGEKFLCQGESVHDEETGTSRVLGKALKDNKEGWVTTKGSKGTVYAESADKKYTVVKPVELQARLQTGSAGAKRTLAEGETVMLLEGPKEEKAQPVKRIKVCALSDKAIGWISKSDSTVKKWNPVYRTLMATPLQIARSSLASEGCDPVRELAKGEALELLEGPVKEEGEVRMRCKANKDGATGWVTLRDAKGKHVVDC
eukprot:TRINITY_DN1004_c0_g1_i5.p1 TRINITY_DN1004_c0_g1~~TRINITY_DN1004_c0_g1_i5.p1  ORF type:complete len:1783 (-),score=889.31 TRINITY_DN1004_c0_g1_i5:290-5638(-)